MENKIEQLKSLIQLLQSGYYVGRQTQKNERLAFLLIFVAITKRSIPQVVIIRRDQFLVGRYDCIFRGFFPRNKRVYRIHLPMSFLGYLDDYCFRYRVPSNGCLFSMNPEYVGNRVRELVKLQRWDISIGDIQKAIPYAYNSEEYKAIAYELLNMLWAIPCSEQYICTTAVQICSSIQEFERRYS